MGLLSVLGLFAVMGLLTVKELEADSKISRFTWRSWIKAGKLASVHLGRRVRVEESDYRAFVAKNRHNAKDNGR